MFSSLTGLRLRIAERICFHRCGITWGRAFMILYANCNFEIPFEAETWKRTWILKDFSQIQDGGRLRFSATVEPFNLNSWRLRPKHVHECRQWQLKPANNAQTGKTHRRRLWGSLILKISHNCWTVNCACIRLGWHNVVISVLAHIECRNNGRLTLQ